MKLATIIRAWCQQNWHGVTRLHRTISLVEYIRIGKWIKIPLHVVWYACVDCAAVFYDDGRRTMGDEIGVRKFVHAALLKKDVQYKAIEMIHMKEDTGEIHVKWLDRENRHREDRFKYHRKV